jgi:hypothetical protein
MLENFYTRLSGVTPILLPLSLYDESRETLAVGTGERLVKWIRRLGMLRLTHPSDFRLQQS